MEEFEIMQEKYAELAVKVGANIQEGQTLLVFADIGASSFVHQVVRQAYKAGARHVYVDWRDDELQLTMFQMAPEEALKEFPQWKADGYAQIAKEGGALLAIRSANPDALKDADPKRIATYQKAAAIATKEFADYQMKRIMRWSIVAVPSTEWASKVFPNLSEEAAVEQLWKAIFKITRVDGPNPVAAWTAHLDTLAAKREELNQKSYRKLHYRAPGTELSIELPQGHAWYGGGSKTPDGHTFVANMPTEEVFTLPKRDGVNGTVRATKPLSYGGHLIDNFSFTFKDGQIVDFQAEQGYEVLQEILNSDDGSHYLGEVALVPVDSPISNSNLLFYETLFDENASCHLAIGRAYPCFKDVEQMSEEDITAAGANMSLVHVDFMMGSPEMAIDGELADGTIESVFRDGNWVK